LELAWGLVPESEWVSVSVLGQVLELESEWVLVSVSE
jgi:hypothetical protein